MQFQWEPVEEHSRIYFFPNGDSLVITKIIGFSMDDNLTHHLLTRNEESYVVHNTWSYMKHTHYRKEIL